MVDHPREGPSAGQRLAVVAAVAAATGIGLGFVMPWPFALLCGWDAGATFFVAAVWISIWSLTPEEAATHATREDSSRAAAQLSLIGACVACLGGVGYSLIYASRSQGAAMGLVTALAIGSVLLSWLVVQTVFTLRYARLYYRNDPGGIDFNEDEQPVYFDFAYLAFTVGMTYQVSDTDLKTKTIRHEALRHALLSYLFGTVIIAVTINAVASLLK